LIRILIWTIALGFLVEELPRARRLRRVRAARRRLEQDRTRARLALAIDEHWAEFGCARAMTGLERANAMARVEMIERGDVPPN